VKGTTEHQHNANGGVGRDLIPDHLEFLTGKAIKPEILIQAGVRSAVEPADLPGDADPWWPQKLPAKLYPWRMNGLVEWQLAPDDPGDGPKYLFRDGSKPPLDCYRDDGGHGPILLVEGTK
jgi:hypothetical protein